MPRISAKSISHGAREPRARRRAGTTSRLVVTWCAVVAGGQASRRNSPITAAPIATAA
jgi:hypothetical protein